MGTVVTGLRRRRTIAIGATAAVVVLPAIGFAMASAMRANRSPEWVQNNVSLFFKYAAPMSGGPVTIFSGAFSATGLVVLYKNQAYRAIATANHDFRLWVLCKRSPEDDPEPEE